MVGWIGFSCLPAVGGIADIRDAVQAIINGDAVGAAMNAAGALPGPGDGVKVTGAVACFTGKYPWKAKELGVLLSKEIMPHLPDSIKIDVWNVLYDGAASRLITKYDINADDVSKLTRRGIDLSEVVHVIRVGEDVIPVIKDRFVHAKNRHIYGTEGVDDPTSFFPTTERVIRNGEPNPGASSLTPEEMETQIIEWIDEALRQDLTEWPKQKTPVTLDLNPEVNGIGRIKIIVQGDTGVHTVIPFSGSQVYKWAGDKWIPTTSKR